MIRILLALFGAMFFGGAGAFFLFVPPLLIATALIATVVLLLTGFMLLYCFGINSERRPVPASDPKD